MEEREEPKEQREDAPPPEGTFSRASGRPYYSSPPQQLHPPRFSAHAHHSQGYPYAHYGSHQQGRHAYRVASGAVHGPRIPKPQVTPDLGVQPSNRRSPPPIRPTSMRKRPLKASAVMGKTPSKRSRRPGKFRLASFIEGFPFDRGRGLFIYVNSISWVKCILKNVAVLAH